MRYCKSCDTVQPLNNFWKGMYTCIPCSKHKQKHVWHSRSKENRKNEYLKRKYGLTYEQFIHMWETNGGACEICRQPLNPTSRGHAIDHNHNTGEVRGLLCLNCNSMLGMARDNIATLAKAIEYLSERGSYAASEKVNESNG